MHRGFGQVGDNEVDLRAEQVVQRRGSAFVRDVGHIKLGIECQQFQAKMRWRAIATGACAEPLGTRLG